MRLDSVEDRLELIDADIHDLSRGNFESLLKNIDAFQQDPAALLHSDRIPGYVELLTSGVFEQESDLQLLKCQVFYNLAKVVTWKRIVVYLPTDVFLVVRLVEMLEKDGQSWFVAYFLLSWTYILTLSPFRFDEMHERIYRATGRYEHLQTLKPIVARIQAQLLSKNADSFKARVQDLDVLTTNYLLKEIKPDSPLIDDSMLRHFNSMCLRQGNDIITLKLLPKLVRLNAFHDNWEAVEDIVSFYIASLDNHFTNYRFALAHSFAKVVNSMIEDFDDLDTATELVKTCVNHITKCFYETPPSLIDHDFLHTNLLIIAELSQMIAKKMPQMLDVIVTNLIPPALAFQQLKMNEIRGSQIKDASAFICWSLARSARFPDVVFSPKLKMVLFLNSLVCSLFDRDLLVRRSANAALQETLGRCIAATDLLDNEAIMMIIELPILNLADNCVDNAQKLYELFNKEKRNEPYALFMLNWLFDNNFSKNHDVNTVELTIKMLLGLAREFPVVRHLMKAKLDKLIITASNEDVPIAVKKLHLVVDMESEGLFFSEGLAAKKDADALLNLISNSVRTSHNSRGNDVNEYFKFFVILKYWKLSMERVSSFSFTEQQVTIMFHIIRMTSDSLHYNREIRTLFNELVRQLSRNPRLFSSQKNELSFWTQFEKLIRLDNSLTSSALPELPPIKFKEILSKSLPVMDCQRKSQLLDSLDSHLPMVVRETGSEILKIITHYLDDYTITQQGDVGRLVRFSASKLVVHHKHIFWEENNGELINDILSSFLRLSGEQVKDLRVLCFNMLCDVYDHRDKCCDEISNPELLAFQHLIFQGKSNDFWKGYMLTGGAIKFSISEVTTTIDDFLFYYYSLPKGQHQLEICNNLVRVIPSAKEVALHQKTHQQRSLGITGLDIIKNTVKFLNFWIRLMESGIVVDPKFNFDGFYAKIHNLNLLEGSILLKLATIQILPHLLSMKAYSAGKVDKTLANRIIRRLLILVRREKQQNAKVEYSLVQKASIEALAQIYVEHRRSELLEILKNATTPGGEIMTITDSQLSL